MIWRGDYLKLDLVSHYPVLGIYDKMIDTTTPFSIPSFQFCGKQTNVGGEKKEGNSENSFASHLLNSDSNHPIQLRAAQGILLQPFPAPCATTDFQQFSTASFKRHLGN